MMPYQKAFGDPYSKAVPGFCQHARGMVCHSLMWRSTRTHRTHGSPNPCTTDIGSTSWQPEASPAWCVMPLISICVQHRRIRRKVRGAHVYLERSPAHVQQGVTCAAVGRRAFTIKSIQAQRLPVQQDVVAYHERAVTAVLAHRFIVQGRWLRTTQQHGKTRQQRQAKANR